MKRGDRVLVIEDDLSSQTALVRLLGKRGYQAMGAATVECALALLPWEPSCVLLDLMLPDEDGVSFLRHVREKQIPVRVAVTTAAHDPGLIRSAKALEPDAFYTKPLDFQAVVDWVGTSCGAS